MRLIPSDPDVETIVRRIKSKDIDLQPDFQRGEVWTQPKQKRLVDSVLRNWHIPPIHVVENEETNVQEVLDGQQRLAAIRDFVNGVFPVDGRIEPYDEEINALHGKRYEELPPEWRRGFDQFAIRVFKIVEFEPEEPAELFFRLNQPTKLTTAEQRNAFFGPARSLVKKLSNAFSDVPIGFSNARMAIDDVVARVCMSVEHGNVVKKVTATKLADRYRSREPFDGETIDRCEKGIANFTKGAEDWGDAKVKLNKAMLYSWLWVSVNTPDDPVVADLFGKAVPFVESLRNKKQEALPKSLSIYPDRKLRRDKLFSLVQMYFDRSSSRVSDVSSVVGRDFFLWMCLSHVNSMQSESCDSPRFDDLGDRLDEFNDRKGMTPNDLIDELLEADWGYLV